VLQAAKPYFCAACFNSYTQESIEPVDLGIAFCAGNTGSIRGTAYSLASVVEATSKDTWQLSGWQGWDETWNYE
jgi:hypothetical protein